ncbi:MAG TPA: hypothetical protein VKM56_06520 [Verrucomicrobiae bacterium]|nr:hypothetical protein [Verrucomicrobiae bacterium]
MKTVSMLEFRRDAAKVLRLLRLGKETIRLTYRGQAVADLVPVKPDLKKRPPRNDPFYRLPEIAIDGQPLTNRDIDRLLYEQP